MATKHLTMAQFKVDLGKLESAIRVVRTQAGVISEQSDYIAMALPEVAPVWVTPAGGTFEELVPPVTKQMHTLVDLLDQMVQRMQAAHQTYLQMEQTNTNNLQHK